MDTATFIGLGTVALGIGLMWWQASHRAGLWKSRLRALGLNQQGEGVLDGRGVSVTESRGILTISVCIANRSRLFDEVRADDLLALARWISPLTRAQLTTLAPLRGDWRASVVGRTLTLSGQSATIRHPELLGYLVTLACELAEGVDSRAFSTRAAMAR
ncbi:MAG: hypothetical protein QM758_16660 [Armatimonas sp.]